MRLKKLIALLLALMLCACTPAFAEYNMPYYIGVDLTNQIVTIYNTQDGSIVRQMLTSSGMNDCTPEGTFYLTEKGRLSERGEWTWFRQYQCWVKYATRIHLGYMFHSLPFAEKDMNTMIEQSAKEFGMPTSHGCMRLRVDDARFIAKECLQGTRVTIYKADKKEEELRALLLVSSYTADSGMSYMEFLGYSQDALGRDSSGPEVSDLQHRLCDLGYYDGAAGGVYDTATTAAVKRVQQDLGVAENGIATKELLDVLYSDAAPVSAGEATIIEGRSGPVVHKLQTALNELGFYQGEMDSIYDLEVSDAIRMFQGACNYPVDGVASPEIQQALYYLQAQLEERFGEGQIPPAEIVREGIDMARLESEANIIIREKPNTKSNPLGKLRNGDTMLLNAVDGDWASITVGQMNGYVRKKYLKPYTQENVIMRYADAGGASYQIGHTLEEYRAGAKGFADEFSAYYASEQFTSAAVDTVLYATVSTGNDAVNLNLRAQPSAEAEILAEIPNGTFLRALEQLDGWTRVGYNDKIGYLMNNYLEFREGSADEVESTELEAERAAAQLDFEADESIFAIVVCAGEEGSVPVYESGSEDAAVLGKLRAGVQVEVLQLGASDDWVRIKVEGRERYEGYMLDANLQFQLM